MENIFVPIPGASGFQLSNPSALDMTAVSASLDVFSLTTMDALRARSIRLTAYLEARLLGFCALHEVARPSRARSKRYLLHFHACLCFGFQRALGYCPNFLSPSAEWSHVAANA